MDLHNQEAGYTSPPKGVKQPAGMRPKVDLSPQREEWVHCRPAQERLSACPFSPSRSLSRGARGGSRGGARDQGLPRGAKPLLKGYYLGRRDW